MSLREHQEVTAFARASTSGRAPTYRHAAWFGAIAVGLLALLQAGPRPALSVAALGKQAAPAPIVAPDGEGALEAYGKLPLAFVPNEGQTDARVRFSAQAGGASFWFTNTEAALSFVKEKSGVNLRLRFLGANPAAAVEGTRLLPGKVNYLIGKDPTKWQTNLPTYAEVVYRDLWPGIDLAFRGRKGTLKYEFRLAPGARASDIRLAYRGAGGLALDQAGNLLIRTPLGPLADSRPLAYQEIGGRRIPVESRYTVAGISYGLALGVYDRARPLVIDPGLLYSTYLGGSAEDRGFGVAVDATGNAYVTGFTTSNPFPTTPGAFDTSYNGSVDAFVTKLNAAGSAPLYSTYLGGSGNDRGFGIAVDATGNAYVTGITVSNPFPTTTGAFDTSFNGGPFDAFVTKLNAAGSALLYSTYLGGSDFDRGRGIGVDAAGNAYVTGSTASNPFPTTTGAFDTTYNGGRDAFVTKLNVAGSTPPLLYSTYLGGSGFDEGRGRVAVDAAGNAYVTGLTSSDPFPTTPAAFDTTYNGAEDGFVTKLNAAGSAPLLYSTYLGGSGEDEGVHIAVDAGGNAYVTGITASNPFPTTPGAFDTSFNGLPFDAFVTKLNAAGSALLYSTYLGGSGDDQGNDVAVDAAGNAYVTGSTASNPFPTTTGAFDTTYNGGAEAFVTKLATAPVPATLVLSPAADANPVGTSHTVTATVTDAFGNPVPNVVVRFTVTASGSTVASDSCTTDVSGQCTFTYTGPTAPRVDAISAFADTDNDSVQDAGEPSGAATKTWTPGPPATLVLSPAADANPVETMHTVTATVTDAFGNPVPNVVVRFSVTGSVSTSGSCTTDANGQCSFTYQGPPLPGADAITAFADTNNDGDQNVGEPGGVAEKTWVLPVSTPGCEVKIVDNAKITALNTDAASFHGRALVSLSGVSGTQRYEDHGPVQPLTVQSINVLAVVCSVDRTEATIFGEATVNGSGSFDYRIRVKDLGEPGKGMDVYGILLSNGYFSGDQTLETGNVQITVQA